jgi:hypothetical protein
MVGKATDSRAAAFKARHGRLVQVELEALAPDDLRQLFEDALAQSGTAAMISPTSSTFSCDIAYSPQPSYALVWPSTSNQYSRKCSQRPCDDS